MGSASRSALEASLSALDGQKSIGLDDGEQLLVAARAMAGSAQLLGLLSDPAISSDDKATIVSRVFGGFGKPATAVLLAAVAERWSASADLVDGVEELGIRAIAGAGTTKTVEAELFTFARAVAGDAPLELALGAKLGDPAGKASLVDALLGKKASDATLAIARHLVQSPRGRRVGQLFRRAADIVAASSDRVVVTVTSAIELSSAQRKRIASAVGARYGLTAQVNAVVDPSIVGGLRVQVGDDVIDGTVVTRLDDLRTRLVG